LIEKVHVRQSELAYVFPQMREVERCAAVVDVGFRRTPLLPCGAQAIPRVNERGFARPWQIVERRTLGCFLVHRSTPIRGDESISPQSLHYDRPNSKVVLELLRNEVGGNVERNITRDVILTFFKLDPKRSAQGMAPFFAV
jgi:hypothetical protein